MRLEHPLLTKAGGLALTTVTRAWMSTLDYRVAYYDRSTDPALPTFRGPAIFIFWHEYIPFMFYLRGHCHIAMLLSQHRDAEWLSEASRHMGFDTVRGSTYRGGVAALRELLRCREMNLTMTPDGPRGPRRELAQGAIYLSSRLGIPLVALGLGYDRPWRMNTWDRFAAPRPYTRARAIHSPPIHIPRRLNRSAVAHYRHRVEVLLNRLTEHAEQWATSGARIEGEQPMRREPAPLPIFRHGAPARSSHDEPLLRSA